jgi:hypothetical protein
MGIAWFTKMEATKSVGTPGTEYDLIIDNFIIVIIIIIIIITRLKKKRFKFDNRPLTTISKFYGK